MSTFPADLTDNSQNITTDLLDNYQDQELLSQLHEKGYELHQGLTQEFVMSIVSMAQEPAIKEYCPNDSGSRFADIEATREWLKKGRAVFTLLKRKGSNLTVVGYGWAGKAKSEQVPAGEVTFAIRLGEAGQGQGLATPFSRLIIAAAAHLYQSNNFWLETWASNAAAVHIYHKIGFVDAGQETSQRPTTKGATVADTRLYMSLPNEVLK